MVRKLLLFTDSKSLTGFRLVPNRWPWMAVVLRYLPRYATSKWLKLDPCCLWQKCSQTNLLFGNVWPMTPNAHFSPNSPQMTHLFSSLYNVAKRRDIFPFHSPGGVTNHTVYRATPLLSTPTVYAWLGGHLSNNRVLVLLQYSWRWQSSYF